MLALAQAAYGLGCDRGILLDCIHTTAPLVPLFERLGYRVYSEGFCDPDLGPRTTMVLRMRDLTHFAFGSFVWAIRRYFRLGKKTPVPAQWMQGLGGLFMLVHLSLILTANPIPARRACVAVALYSFCLAIFWSAVRAHGVQRPSHCFGSALPVRLVVTGPYRWVRHPFYLSYTLAWSAGVLVTGQWWLVSSAVVMGAFYISAALREERGLLSSPLAGEFELYRTTTGMFFPKLSFAAPSFAPRCSDS